MLFQVIKKFGENAALITRETGTITYNDIEYQVNILKKKIPSKSLTILLCENSIAPIIIFFL